MQYVLLVISVAVTLGYNLLRNRFSKHNARNQADFHSFNAVCSLFSAAALLIFALAEGRPLPEPIPCLRGLPSACSPRWRRFSICAPLNAAPPLIPPL